MDIVIMIICATLVLGVLVVIHEGGHFLAARAFGVRVTELMMGLPGPALSFKYGDTRFGVTAILLGGYARICGMEPGDMHPQLKQVLCSIYTRGTANMEDVAQDVGIDPDDAYEALMELSEWGCVVAPKKTDEFNTFRAREVTPTKRQVRRAIEQAAKAAATEEETAAMLPVPYEEGQPRPVSDPDALFDFEYRQQYRSLPFWKRSVIILAGPLTNLVFAMLLFLLIYSVIGMDVQLQSGEVRHMTLNPLQSIQAGFSYVVMVVQAVIGLFNPATAAETVSNSTSVVGIAVMSKTYFDAGLVYALSFTAMISVSLGIMNMLPIPPLDGGRFIVEVLQKLARRNIPPKAINAVTMAGMALFLLFFAVMLNQDIQRFVFGNWG